MEAQATLSRWRAVGKSVRGASHHRSGLPNQDAIAWSPVAGEGPPLILAIADGHGSSTYFRSDQGSRLAVDTAVKVLEELLQAVQTTPSSLSAFKRIAEERLPQEISRRWKDRVAEHLKHHPWQAAEWEKLVQKKGPGARDRIESHPELAYGATLIASLVTASFILYLQLGDGDILTVSEAGVVEAPMPKDERLLANETTSLCSAEAWRDFRFCFQVPLDDPPALIMITTDGYANSFAKTEGFHQSASDYLSLIRNEGLDTVVEYIEPWLNEVSSSGSGDDVTLGMLCRMDACSKANRTNLHPLISRYYPHRRRVFKAKQRAFYMRRHRQARKFQYVNRNR